MNEQEVAVQLTAHDHEISSLKHRACKLEAASESMTQLVRSVDKLAMNMERMLAEQTAQGERLARLEAEPGEQYKYYKRLIVGCVITGVISAVVGAVLATIF